ncbi:MAG: helix-turn-helix domain-containing protein [Candidatus Marsarchaeota archaeon]|nr:helix-turn-helix domain-containing protein [Candidatus Marsarchaeota archaeon]
MNSDDLLSNCDDIFKLTIPATRASITKRLVLEYEMSQESIAKALGIEQAAVSKYVNGRYSPKIKRIVTFINENGLDKKISKQIYEGATKAKINKGVDALASSQSLVKEATRLLKRK